MLVAEIGWVGMVGNREGRERLVKLFKSWMYRTGWFTVDGNGEGRKLSQELWVLTGTGFMLTSFLK